MCEPLWGRAQPGVWVPLGSGLQQQTLPDASGRGSTAGSVSEGQVPPLALPECPCSWIQNKNK